MCSHHGRNGFSPHKNGSCLIAQLFSRPKVSKSHCVVSQEPFLFSVKTLSSQSGKVLRSSWPRTEGHKIFCSQDRQRVLDESCPGYRTSRQPSGVRVDGTLNISSSWSEQQSTLITLRHVQSRTTETPTNDVHHLHFLLEYTCETKIKAARGCSIYLRFGTYITLSRTVRQDTKALSGAEIYS